MRNVPHLNTDNEGSDQSNTATRIHRHLYHQWHQVTAFLLGCGTRSRLQDVPQLSSFLLWPKLALPCTGASIFHFESIASSSATRPSWRDRQPERATLGQTTGPTLKRARWRRVGTGLCPSSPFSFGRVWASEVTNYFSCLSSLPLLMARRTRSGAQWSAWELDELRAGPSIVPPCIQIVCARVSLALDLRDAMEAVKQRATVHDTMDGRDDNEWEDEDPVLSRPATPISRPATPLPTTSWSCSPSPLSDLPPSPPPTASASPCASLTLDALPSPISRRKE
jgi:hypothetical protein